MHLYLCLNVERVFRASENYEVQPLMYPLIIDCEIWHSLEEFHHISKHFCNRVQRRGLMYRDKGRYLCAFKITHFMCL